MKDLGDKLCEYCPWTDDGRVNTGPHNLCEGSKCDEAYERYKEENLMRLSKVIFNGPATILIWDDGTKTISKCKKGDKQDREKGFLIAFFRKASGLTKTQTNKMMKEFEETGENNVIKKEITIGEELF